MTGFNSKRKMAQAKVQEEMQVIFTQRQAERDKLQDEPDMLLIVYQRGFADGKNAQRKWVGLTDEDKKKIATAAGCTEDDDGHIVTEIFKLAEAKLKERNT